MLPKSIKLMPRSTSAGSAEGKQVGQNAALGGGTVDFGAPVLGFSAGGQEVVADGEVVLAELTEYYGDVITPTPGNSASAIGGISADEIEAFLCANYEVTLHQELLG